MLMGKKRFDLKGIELNVNINNKDKDQRKEEVEGPRKRKRVRLHKNKEIIGYKSTKEDHRQSSSR